MNRMRYFIINMLIFLMFKFNYLSKFMSYRYSRKILGNEGRIKAWRKLGATIEEDVKISAGVSIRFPQNVTIGQGSSLGGVWIDSWGKVIIGKNVLMNDDISLYSAGHLLDSPNFAGDIRAIKIGDHVWLPHNIIVLPGVTIGNCAVIGTGSVVSRDVPDYGIAVGNPAKVVKERAKIDYTYIPSQF